MENLSQALPHNKMKEVRLKAIIGISCMFLGILPFIGVLFTLVSWILFFIVLYDLSVYSGAKSLFRNFFISLGILFFGYLISISAIFTILQPHVSLFGGLYFESSNIIGAIIAFLVIFLATMGAIFPFMKAWYFEIARVTGQKYFIYAFWAHFIGFCTLPVFGLGALGIIASIIFQLIAWINFNNESLDNSQNSPQKQIFDFDLKWIKILMVISLIFNLTLNTLYIVFNLLKSDALIFSHFEIFYNIKYKVLGLFGSEMFSNTDIFLRFSLVFLALLSLFLFCKKLNSYKIFSYFFLWQALFIIRSYQGDIFNFLLGENYTYSMEEILLVVLRVALIISAFLFFKLLVQITNNKFFFFVFILFACREFLRILLNLFDFNINTANILYNSSNSLDIIYIFLFLTAWLSLNNSKNSLNS